MKIEITVDDTTQDVSAAIAGVETPDFGQKYALGELTRVTEFYREQLGFPELPPTGDTNGTPG